MRAILIFPGILSVMLGCGPIAQNHSTQQVTNGRTITAQDVPSVVMVYRESGAKGGVCTGTWISKTAILTAAHCFAGLPRAANGRVNTVVNIIEPKDGLNADFITKTTEVYVNPEWSVDANAGVVAGDLALIVFPAAEINERPRAVSKVSATPAKIKDTVVMVGYGATRVTEQGDGEGLGVKRIGQNTISEFNDGFINFISPAKSSDFSGRSGGAAQGDSGGPLFNSKFELIGISSGGRPSEDGRFVLNEYVDLSSSTSQRFFARYSSMVN